MKRNKRPRRMVQKIIVLAAVAYIFTAGCIHYFLPDMAISFFKLLAAAWIFITLVICMLCYRWSRYRAQTGRSYLKDFLNAPLPYHDLMDIASSERRLDVSGFDKTRWQDTDGIFLGRTEDGRLIRRPSSGEGSVLIMGGPGTGKTAMLIETVLQFDGSVICLQIKGDILQHVRDKRRMVVFSPAAPEHSASFDPLRPARGVCESERRIALIQIATIILPDDPSPNGMYFVTTGRDFFCGISEYMFSQNPNVSFGDIIDAVLTGNAVDWALRIDKSDCQTAKIFTSPYIGSNEKNIHGAYSELAKHCRPFCGLADILYDSGDCITPQTIEDGIDIYIDLPQDQVDTHMPCCVLLLSMLMATIEQRPDISSGDTCTDLLIVLDEFGSSVSRVLPEAMIDRALSTYRSKRCSLILIVQSIPQLWQRYGREATSALVSNVKYLVVLSAPDPDSQLYLQNLIGYRKTPRRTTTAHGSRGSTTMEIVSEPIFRPGDFNWLGSKALLVTDGCWAIVDMCNYYLDK